ncbi:hypothetical protein HDV05_002960, partial [Chytridiales sp. JEL 0842]
MSSKHSKTQHDSSNTKNTSENTKHQSKENPAMTAVGSDIKSSSFQPGSDKKDTSGSATHMDTQKHTTHPSAASTSGQQTHETAKSPAESLAALESAGAAETQRGDIMSKEKEAQKQVLRDDDDAESEKPKSIEEVLDSEASFVKDIWRRYKSLPRKLCPFSRSVIEIMTSQRALLHLLIKKSGMYLAAEDSELRPFHNKIRKRIRSEASQGEGAAKKAKFSSSDAQEVLDTSEFQRRELHEALEKASTVQISQDS